MPDELVPRPPRHPLASHDQGPAAGPGTPALARRLHYDSPATPWNKLPPTVLKALAEAELCAGTATARAFVGSENFSAASLTKNRELGVTTTTPAVVNALDATVTADYHGAQAN